MSLVGWSLVKQWLGAMVTQTCWHLTSHPSVSSEKASYSLSVVGDGVWSGVSTTYIFRINSGHVMDAVWVVKGSFLIQSK